MYNIDCDNSWDKDELIDTLWNVNIAKFVMIVTPVAN